MRPIAVGRKNWLHVGSVQPGPKVAAILSIVILSTVESSRRLGVSVKEYLTSVLPGLNGRTIREVERAHAGPLVGLVSPQLAPGLV